MAVRAAQLDKRKEQVIYLALTLVLGLAFLFVPINTAAYAARSRPARTGRW